MSAAMKFMRNIAEQFGSAIQEDKMASKMVKALLATTVMASQAVAVPEAQAQQKQEVLPQQSAVYWGQMLGQVLGASAGAVAAQGLENRGVAYVLQGVVSEVGRNLGGMTVNTVYGAAKPSPSAASMPQDLRDTLDNEGLRAAFALEDLMRLRQAQQMGRATQTQVNMAQFEFFQARDALEARARQVRAQGYPVEPWFALNDELRRNPVSAERVAALAAPMAERLNRPGGPGYRSVAQAQSTGSLADLRARVEGRRQTYEPARPVY
ncbi:MAG: hypothetical protein N2690_05590 [Rhodocyclaceae bacterium]|nr:hypothetical protein [Rhodocyclaceae bacterium]